jgi:hypothetical protein
MNEQPAPVLPFGQRSPHNTPITLRIPVRIYRIGAMDEYSALNFIWRTLTRVHLKFIP